MAYSGWRRGFSDIWDGWDHGNSSGGYGYDNNYNQGYNNGYGNSGRYTSPEPPEPVDITPTQAVKSAFQYAVDLGKRRSIYPSDAEVSLKEKMTFDFLAFLGYIYDPESAEPIRQVEQANKLLGLRLTTQRFFAIRQENCMDQRLLQRAPVSLQYFVKVDLSPDKKKDGMSLAKFLVNTFRDLGMEFISFGGVSEREMEKLKEYLTMLHNYLMQNGLYFAQDPYRPGPKGDPTYGIPGMKSAMPDAGVDFSKAAYYYEDEPVTHTLFEGIEDPQLPPELAKGIDMPAKKKPAKNMQGQAVKEKKEKETDERMSVRSEQRSRTYGEEKKGEPAENLDELMAEMDSLIGLGSVKENLSNLINVIRIRKVREEMGLAQPDMSLHLVFSGNPGTGKTTVARLLARIYKALGVVSQGQLVEVDRAGLVEGYVGQTAQKTQEVIDSALGGVLFIDEAYTLTNKKDSSDYGQEAVDTLLKRMEDDRDSFVVIAAGYTEPMEQFLESNPGLRSRFSKTIEFEDYSPDELFQILESMCKSQDFHLTPEAEAEVRRHFTQIVDEKEEHFANAREVRNFFERCIERQANRLIRDTNIARTELMTLVPEDVTE